MGYLDDDYFEYEQNQKKLKEEISKTPEQNFYRGGTDLPFFEQRQLLQEPDYREIAATEAGKINHNSVQEYLSDCDKIYNWLIQKQNKR